ncbi:hypothetical protein GOV06_03940 [Candidatus Woesearchaeota archaeon]|nr:hypothetical protein [Candidatus Woesearchaeota archaeon]
MKTKIKLPRLTPEQAWVLNQYVMCGETHDKELLGKAQKLNEEFIDQYWKTTSVDLYLALSMRSLEDIQGAESICNRLEDEGNTVYNPGNNCTTSRYLKHDLEKYMLSKTKKGVVMDAGTKDSGGKFMELCFGILVHRLPGFMLAENEKQYKVYHDYHPISILLGPHVCKTQESLLACIDIETDRRAGYNGETKEFRDEIIDGRRTTICKNCDSIIRRYEHDLRNPRRC